MASNLGTAHLDRIYLSAEEPIAYQMTDIQYMFIPVTSPYLLLSRLSHAWLHFSRRHIISSCLLFFFLTTQLVRSVVALHVVKNPTHQNVWLVMARWNNGSGAYADLRRLYSFTAIS